MFTLLVLLAVWLDIAAADFPDCVNGPLASNLVCDTTANYTERAAALVANLTLEEVAANLDNSAPGVPRLGRVTLMIMNEPAADKLTTSRKAPFIPMVVRGIGRRRGGSEKRV